MSHDRRGSESHRKITRRTAGKLVIALPAAAISATSQEPAEETSPTAEFIAEQAPGLSEKEREKLKEKVTALEGALQKIRDFQLPPDVLPSLRFTPMKSRRS